MSSHNTIKRLTISDLKAKKIKNEPIIALTAYHAYGAKLADPYCDFLLVGDSVGMVIYGLDSTLPVTLDMMIQHGKAVVRASERAMIVVDMPFGSYEASKEIAYENAAKILSQTGCAAVKLEGGTYMAETIAFLVERGIPVMGHIGLTPQAVNLFGGFKTQGKTQAIWDKICQDACAVEEAGAFAMVLEGMIEPLAQEIAHNSTIATIGIGASVHCDGQILVAEDLLGFHSWTPKFVRRYGNLAAKAQEAIKAYAEDVAKRQFPGNNEVYRLNTD